MEQLLVFPADQLEQMKRRNMARRQFFEGASGGRLYWARKKKRYLARFDELYKLSKRGLLYH